MVQQVRTQHANEIRKRDHQISRMKERLLEKSRGGRGNKQPISFPGVTLSGTSSTTHLGGSIGNEDSVPGGTDLALTDDTTAILTALSQNLADENDTLVSMIKSTVTTLKAISGMDTEVDQEAELEEGERNVITNDISYASLSNNVDEVLEHLKEMLNQPNYVPLEDLDARDREIERLGLQLRGTLEAWKNAIALVDLVNKQPDRTNSKKIRALEDVIERERRAVLEELDVNFQAIPPAETPPESTGNHAEGVDIWQLEVEEKLNQPTKKLTFQAEEVDEVDEAGEIEPTESQVYLNEKRIADAGEEEFLSGSQTSGGGEEGMEQTTARDGCTEASVDLVSFPIEDDSSMEVLSPTKPSIYTKKRQIVDATSPSLHLTKRTRFIDTSEKKKGRK
ncbi:hypothetical protein TWF225_011558 [Orbilia oligospora]|nr:hypothetical protein TWF751_011763 [Orbilia oligospora]KAF3192751.1 hypothetical protein TWF225_011558 [Orbilia oligospora]KAF3234630.1 hypothetical protein TWF128_002284 [Orbilia oligospora]KAF3262907.1 hypothetical protein TWF217_004187 [Orbilia oligospora]KAF3287129.1 hypothetical protein TWF132_008658 [Orbilia oligospora]